MRKEKTTRLFPCTWFLSRGCSSGLHTSSILSATSSHPPRTLARRRRGRRRKCWDIGKGKEGKGRGWAASGGIPAESKDPSRSKGQGSTVAGEELVEEFEFRGKNLVNFFLLSQVLCNQLLSWKLSGAKVCSLQISYIAHLFVTNIIWSWNWWFLVETKNKEQTDKWTKADLKPCSPLKIHCRSFNSSTSFSDSTDSPSSMERSWRTVWVKVEINSVFF